jgi:hypothetical protein
MESDRNEEEGHGGGKRGAPRSNDAIGWGCCETILLNPPSREKNLMGESKVVEEKVSDQEQDLQNMPLTDGTQFSWIVLYCGDMHICKSFK